MPPYDPSQHDPLAGLPDELCNGGLEAMRAVPTGWTMNRRYLFDVLQRIQMSHSENKMTSRQIWQVLVPFRPALTAFSSSFSTSDRESYDWIIDSLDNWFRRAPLTRIEYVQWSIAALIDVMLSNNLGVRSAQFSAAAKALEDLLRTTSKAKIGVLQSFLMQQHLHPSSF